MGRESYAAREIIGASDRVLRNHFVRSPRPEFQPRMAEVMACHLILGCAARDQEPPSGYVR